MKPQIRHKIRSEAELEYKEIPENVSGGAREVAEDKIIDKVCQKYGYVLSDYYNTNSKNLI